MLLRLSQVDAIWPAIRAGSVQALVDSATEHDAVVEALLWQRRDTWSGASSKRSRRALAPPQNDSLLQQPRKVSHQAATCFIVAPNVDALATIRILTLLHQADSLPYHVYPIQQYSEIARLPCNGLSIADQESDQRGSSLRAIFFINCGAGVDVGALLNLPAESDLPLFVLDAHRPYHLRNLESAHVIVLHDSDVLDTRLPDSGYEDILGRVPPSNANADDDESSASDLDSTNGSAVDERRRHGARHGRYAVRHYYQRTRRAATSAGVAYALAANLNRATVDTLWCWILAVTEQFLNRQAGDHTWYDQLIRCIREEWKRLTCRRPVTGAGQDAASLPVLEPSEEFSLELLRHWTLYDSLLQSSWLAVRIRSWRQHAERRVSEILAMLGISLRDSRQHWMHMAAEQKDVVRERLVPVLHAYFEADRQRHAGARDHGSGAADVADFFRYESFVRRFGAHRGQTASASDIVFSMNALLDRGSFWRAYALLQCQHIGQMASAFELAKRHQRLLLDAAMSVLERRTFKRGRRAWYAMLDEPPTIISRLDGKRYLQQRLALLLGDRLYASGRHPKPFWLIVSSSNCENASITIVTPQVAESENTIRASCLERDLRTYSNLSPEMATALESAFDRCEPVQTQLGPDAVLALTRCFR